MSADVLSSEVYRLSQNDTCKPSFKVMHRHLASKVTRYLITDLLA